MDVGGGFGGRCPCEVCTTSTVQGIHTPGAGVEYRGLTVTVFATQMLLHFRSQ